MLAGICCSYAKKSLKSVRDFNDQSIVPFSHERPHRRCHWVQIMIRTNAGHCYKAGEHTLFYKVRPTFVLSHLVALDDVQYTILSTNIDVNSRNSPSWLLR